MIVTAVRLTGPALKAEAARLAIPGRSKMSADELRAAIATVSATLDAGMAEPPVAATVAEKPVTVPHQTRPIPAPITPTVFAARWGKRKPSTHNRIHRSR